MLRLLQHKVVAVTGACGIIGSGLCRRLLSGLPFKLLMVARDPSALHDASHALMVGNPETVILPCLGNVTDEARIRQLFSEHQPSVVFHAAQYNNIALMEKNPISAVQNNVFGTKAVADSAINCGAELLVLASCQGAERPTSIVDMTKRVSELYVRALDQAHDARLLSVRLPLRADSTEGSILADDVDLLLRAALAGKSAGISGVRNGSGALALDVQGALTDDEGSRGCGTECGKEDQSVGLPEPDLQDITRRLAIMRGVIKRGDEVRLRRLLTQLTSPQVCRD